MKEKIVKNLIAVKNAFDAFKRNFNKDVPCEKLFENFIHSLDKDLGDYQIKYDYLCGKDTINVDGESKGFCLRDGDTILMDISVGYDGVWCDVTRTFFVGNVKDTQKHIFDLIVKSISVAEKIIKSGVCACDIYSAVDSVFKADGKKLVHHAGHKIGEQPLLQPQFIEQNQTKLNEFDYIAIESGFYGEFGIRLENDYQVLEKGAEDLFSQLMPLNIEEYIL